jgi:hypothetical protein
MLLLKMALFAQNTTLSPCKIHLSSKNNKYFDIPTPKKLGAEIQ